VKSPHFADILFIVEAMNNRARAEEEYCFKEGMSADVEEGKLGLIKADGNYY